MKSEIYLVKYIIMNSNDSKLNYFLLRKEIKEKFPFNKETDCKDKYNEIIQDYLYDEIISKLWMKN